MFSSLSVVTMTQQKMEKEYNIKAENECTTLDTKYVK